MFCQDKPIQNLEMWLAVQYWQVYYDECEERSGGKEGEQDKSKRVTFNDVEEVREIQTEHQIYLMMENITRNQKIKNPSETFVYE